MATSVSRKIAFGLAAVVLAAFCFPHPTFADNLFWTGGNGSQYGDGLNWSFFVGPSVPPAGAIPGPGNFAVFEKSATVSFSDFAPSQPPASGSLQVLNGGVAFTLGPIHFQDALARTYVTSQLYVVAPFEDGAFLQQYNSPGGVNGSLLVTGGTLVVNGSAVIGGGNANNVGTLTLLASQLQTTAGLSVAQSAHGNLNVTASSYVTSSGGIVSIGGQSGSIGVATISGGSVWLLDASSPMDVGTQGSGSLHVEGGSLVSGVTLNIGSSTQTPGSVTVDGLGSQLSFRHFAVGRFGNGNLMVSNGASVVTGGSDASNHTAIGEFQGVTGVATVTGSGSSWITNGLAVGGGSGRGSLTISAGASVTSTDYFDNINGSPTAINSSIGGSQGSVAVTGSGSTWTLTGGLSVSNFGVGNATLTVGPGAAVNMTTALQVNQGGTAQIDGVLNAATININGGAITQTGAVAISDAATHVGILSISNGGTYTGAPTLGVPTPGSTDAAGYAYIQGAGSTWNISGPYQLGAGGGPAAANVTQGAAVHSGDLGIGENTAGQLAVNGSASIWSSTGVITVGSSATGIISVDQGGALSASTLTVNAQGKVRASSGGLIEARNVNVNNGGSIKINGVTLSTTSTTIGSGSMQLTNSLWNNTGTLYVGGDGNVASSGPASAVLIYGGSINVGSTLKVWNQSQIGVDGNATLNLHDVDIEGGSLDVLVGQVHGSGGSLTVAAHGEFGQRYGDFDSASFPSVTVNGAVLNIQNGGINLTAGQSLVVNGGGIARAVGGSFNVGSGANASVVNSTLEANQVQVAGNLTLDNPTLHIQVLNLNGGTITAPTPLAIDKSLDGHGAINGDLRLAGGDVVSDGGSLVVSGNVSGYGVLVGNVVAASVTPTGDLTVSGDQIELGVQSATLVSLAPTRLSGTLTSHGATITSASGILIDAAGIIKGDITIHGDVTNEGLIKVGGDNVGLDTIYGNLKLDPTGTLRIRIGGSDPSEYDRIMVKSGNVTLDGTLDLVFINGYLPKQGDAFNIFIDDFSGAFAHLEVSGLSDWQYSVAPGLSGVTLNSLSNAVAIPEPSTLIISLILSIPGGLSIHRRRHAKISRVG